MSSRIYFDIISICYNTSNISTKKGYTHIIPCWILKDVELGVFK